MGEESPVVPVTLFCGMIATDSDVMLQAKDRLIHWFGEIDLESEIFAFDFTDYYQKEMGANLVRKFFSFKSPIDPGRLADIKTHTNALEREFAASDGLRRRVNLDPGYLDAAKLVLATTKDFAHRIYLGQGIYAEVTLNFRKNGCVYFDWTYPDYRSGRYTPFFLEVRRRHMAGGRQAQTKSDKVT